MEVEGVPLVTPFPESALDVTNRRVLAALLGRWGLIHGRALATRRTPGTWQPVRGAPRLVMGGFMTLVLGARSSESAAT